MNTKILFAFFIAVATPLVAYAEISGSGHRVEGCIGEITSLVWNDANGDGIQDAGEPPLTGVTLLLSRLADPQLGEDALVTGADGTVRFFNLCLSPHLLRVEPASVPPGMLPTTMGGAQSVLDSNTTPALAAVQIDLNEDYPIEESVDFGFVRPGCSGSIGDRVWLDANGDGIQDSNESGLAGANVRLSDSAGQLVHSAVSDAYGRYLFAGVCDGNYQVTADYGGATLTGSPVTRGSDATLDSDDGAGAAHASTGGATRDLDFGFYAPDCSGTIDGFMFDDADRDGVADAAEAGIGGVVVSANPIGQAGTDARIAVTDGSGRYRFAALCAGVYQLEVVSGLPAGTPAFDPAQSVYTTVQTNAGQSVAPSLGYTLGCGASIGDYVWIDTDNNGRQDEDEIGLDGVTVLLRDQQGRTLGQRVTDYAGQYQFKNLCAGTYAVQVDASTVPPSMSPAATGQADADADSDPSQPVWITLADSAVTHAGADFGFYTLQCALRLTPSCGAMSLASSVFVCEKPVASLSMAWHGAAPVRIVAHAGKADDPVLADIDGVAVGDVVTVSGYDDSPKDVVWRVFAAGTGTLLGESWFHLSCSDKDMDGPEDCGLPQGDGKDGNRCDDGCITDWRLAGMIDKEGQLQCRSEQPPTPGGCSVPQGQWVSLYQELHSVGVAGALDVQIDDDNAPRLRNGAVVALPSGTATRYLRAVPINSAYTSTISASATDGVQSCADRTTVSVAATPSPTCALFGSPSLEKSKDKVKWRLTNTGTQDLTVSKLSVEWYEGHGKIKEIKLSDKFVDMEVAPPFAVFSDERMVDDRNKRKFKKGKTEKLEIKFKRDAPDRSDADYKIVLDFEEGCSVTYDVTGNASGAP